MRGGRRREEEGGEKDLYPVGLAGVLCEAALVMLTRKLKTGRVGERDRYRVLGESLSSFNDGREVSNVLGSHSSSIGNTYVYLLV